MDPSDSGVERAGHMTAGPTTSRVKGSVRGAGGEGMIGMFAELWMHRELLATLVRKDLKIRYRGSSLGFLWSMLNPALYLVVFYVVFQLILKSGIPDFAIYLLSGLLVWNLFSSGISGASRSIVDNQALVKKIYLPRAIFPLAAVGSSLVHFVLQLGVLVIVLLVTGYGIGWSYLWLVPIGLITIMIFTSAIGIVLAALNVRNRDVQHFLELALLGWFWMTPIVYPFGLVSNSLGERANLAFLNPVTSVVLIFQRAIYARTTVDDPGTAGALGRLGADGVILPDESQLWYLRNVSLLAAVSVVLLALAVWYFRRVEGDFAEEL